jgi:hypothetical protein
VRCVGYSTHAETTRSVVHMLLVAFWFAFRSRMMLVEWNRRGPGCVSTF